MTEQQDGRDPSGQALVASDGAQLHGLHPTGVDPSRWAKLDAECDEDVADADYWRLHAERGPPLKPLGKPCADCAVAWGFYAGLSKNLARQPKDVVERVCSNWFCHDNPDRACRGNIEFVAYLRASGIETEGHDGATRHGAEHESPAPKGDAHA